MASDYKPTFLRLLSVTALTKMNTILLKTKLKWSSNWVVNEAGYSSLGL
ncbi:rCG30108 [Rattus norvegicus]|uniref:RCG30108 n=1 Tax=Rattus norvegicus TaxID=10116 RepID=A6IN60_RAT|nr:rCG30108 [Rattus norvegicus]